MKQRISSAARRWASALMAVIAFLAAQHAAASISRSYGDEIFSVDQINYKVVDADFKQVTITSVNYSKLEGDVVIPEDVDYKSYGKYEVIGIEDYAFQGATKMTSLTVPSSVREIGLWAFEGCLNLVSVKLPVCVKLGVRVFKNCTSLKEVDLSIICGKFPDGLFEGCTMLEKVTLSSTLTEIPPSAFYECHSLKAIDIPASVQTIGNYAFFECSSLESVKIPDNVTTLENSTFLGCSSLKSIDFGSGVTKLNKYVFSGCSSLESIVIPDAVTSMDVNVFEGCTGLKNVTIGKGITAIPPFTFTNCSGLETMVIPDHIVAIGESAFEDCSSLKEIKFGRGLKQIDVRAFRWCTSLPAITFPDTVSIIPSLVFDNCSNLKEVTLHAGITEIESSAFSNCENLKKVTALGLTPPTLEYAIFDNCPASLVIYVAPESLELYKQAKYWNKMPRILPFNTVAVESLTLNSEAIKLGVDETMQLTATVAPDNAPYKDVTWTSSDPNIAIVDRNGLVTGYSVGEAHITATTGDGLSAEVYVNVYTKCEQPNLVIRNNKLIFETPESSVNYTYVCTVASHDTCKDKKNKTGVVDLAAAYDITVVATYPRYADSAHFWATVYFVKPAKIGTQSVSQLARRPVAVSSNGGLITVSGLENGEAISFYDLNGVALGTAVASDGIASFSHTAGSTIIVKISDRALKVMVR